MDIREFAQVDVLAYLGGDGELGADRAWLDSLQEENSLDLCRLPSVVEPALQIQNYWTSGTLSVFEDTTGLERSVLQLTPVSNDDYWFQERLRNLGPDHTLNRVHVQESPDSEDGESCCIHESLYCDCPEHRYDWLDDDENSEIGIDEVYEEWIRKMKSFRKTGSLSQTNKNKGVSCHRVKMMCNDGGLIGIATLGKREAIKSSEESACPICMEDIQQGTVASKLHCGHLFHTECIRVWLKQSKSNCPMCRQKTSDITIGYFCPQTHKREDHKCEQTV